MPQKLISWVSGKTEIPSCIISFPVPAVVETAMDALPRLAIYVFNQQSVAKIMGKTAIWVISCFYPLPPLNNVKKQRAKLASSYVMGSLHCIGGEGDFQT